MRIRKVAPSPVTAQDKIDLQAVVDAFVGTQPTFDELRAMLPAGRRARFTDGHLAQTAVDLGLVVEP